jgi:hypothetical protein
MLKAKNAQISDWKLRHSGETRCSCLGVGSTRKCKIVARIDNLCNGNTF